MAINEWSTSGSITFSEYSAMVKDTDVLPPEDLTPVLMGLFGEVGGIMSTAKKHVREKNAYPRYQRRAQEEFGDTLWYMAAVCRRLNMPLETIFDEVASDEKEGFVTECAASDISVGAIAHVRTPVASQSLDETLFVLGKSAANLLGVGQMNPTKSKLKAFARCYLEALHISGLVFSDVVRMNVVKTRGAFLPVELASQPSFDSSFNCEERIPAQFKIRINQRAGGRSYLQWNGVFIGDPLTDNIADPDGYRFHDVFHFSYAAILHWSPVFRSLIKQKRKSIGKYDEEEDGGRAIVVEEGLTAWLFSRSKEVNYFEGHDRISYDLLKTIQEFTAGYEVSECPLKLWEKAIIEGYKVFRQVRDAEGGWVIADRVNRTINFAPLDD